MNKLMRHITTASITAVAVGGTLLAGGGAAVAATPQHSGRPGHPAPVAARHEPAPRAAAHHRLDPWIMDQLRLFEPAVARRIAVYEPWVQDQLAWFTAHGNCA
ncbi:hypothetical protein [Streptomyces sp. NPDC056160]|uniref:hypothetical protein n=1 Tax=Streptomyces sp. NPDC056160 TaxID=3345731 RepID=UPI0035E1347A